MCVWFYSSFVCISAFSFVFKSKVHCESAVQFSRALSGYPITAYQIVYVPDVTGLLAVWRLNKPKPKTKTVQLQWLGWTFETQESKKERKSQRPWRS